MTGNINKFMALKWFRIQLNAEILITISSVSFLLLKRDVQKLNKWTSSSTPQPTHTC